MPGEDNMVCSERSRVAHWPTESETLSTCRSFMSGRRESPGATEEVPTSVRLRKARSHNLSMNVTGQSDRLIVPKIPLNESPQLGNPATDWRRRRRKGSLTKGNLFEFRTSQTQSWRARYGEP